MLRFLLHYISEYNYSYLTAKVTGYLYFTQKNIWSTGTLTDRLQVVLKHQPFLQDTYFLFIFQILCFSL